MSLLLKAFNVSLTSLKEAFSVDDFVRNPNFSLMYYQYLYNLVSFHIWSSQVPLKMK
jgi:hypothetical protein